mgnify:CR=1 FL=1
MPVRFAILEGVWCNTQQHVAIAVPNGRGRASGVKHGPPLLSGGRVWFKASVLKTEGRKAREFESRPLIHVNNVEATVGHLGDGLESGGSTPSLGTSRSSSSG